MVLEVEVVDTLPCEGKGSQFRSGLTPQICECSKIGIMLLPVTEEGTGSSPAIRAILYQGSSMVEQHAVNVSVVGSSPTLGASLNYLGIYAVASSSYNIPLSSNRQDGWFWPN